MLKTILIFLIAALVGLFIESTVIHGAAPTAASPDVLMILTVIIALRSRTVSAVVASFGLGLLGDFASGQFVGPNAAGNLVVFGLVGAIASRMYAERSLALMFMVFICSLAKSLTVVFMYVVYLDDYLAQLLRLEVISTALMEAFFSALISPLVIHLVLLGRPSRRSSHGGGGIYGWSE